jgi:hypothetical protein
MTAMEAKSSTVRHFPAKGKEKRPYGKAPLEFGLDVALVALNKIAQEGKSLSESSLAIALGNTVTSSAFTRKIRALAAYALLEEKPGGQFALTELGTAIAFPRSPQAQAEAKKQAFLKIEQFNILFNQHKGKLLPADEFLRNILEQENGIPRDASQQWVKHFNDGAKAAGLLHRRNDGKVQIAESPILEDDPEEPSGGDQNEEKDAQARTANEESIRSGVVTQNPPPAFETVKLPPFGQATVSGHYTRIDLSDGRRAEISIPDKLSDKDAKKIKRALEGIAVIVDSMVSDGS